MSNLYPPHHIGGYEVACQGVVDRWRARGHDVTVLTSDHTSDAEGRPEQHVRRRLPLVAPVMGPSAAPPSRWSRVRAETRTRRVLSATLRSVRPEVISVWNPYGLSPTVLRRVSERTPPTVYVVCDDWPLYLPGSTGMPRWLTRLPSDPTRHTVFAFCSAALRAQVEGQSSWELARTDVVWLGVDPTLFPSDPSTTGQPWRGRLLLVGRVEEAKGARTAVSALADLGQETLEVIGHGAPSYVAELQAHARDLEVDDRLSFDVAPRAQLRERYQAADVLLFPSEWVEPFGIVPLEAMATGRPVVATGAGGSGEYLRDGQNCLIVPPRDPSSLAAAVRRLADDAALRARLVAGGLVTAREVTIDQTASRLLALHEAEARRPDQPA